MTKILVRPGACGFDAVIEATRSNNAVKLKIESKCENIKELAKDLQEVSIEDFYGSGSIAKNKIYTVATNCIRHPACPVPCAIAKAVEAELGLALKKNVSIEFL